MLRKALGVCAMMFLELLGAGCRSEAKSPADYHYPTKRPICLVEYDPNVTIFERGEKGENFQPLPVGKILVMPLYRNYHSGGETDAMAVAHPFLYTQCEDIEKELTALGQRENLARLIVWAHGCFPTGMPHLASWSPTIKEQKVDLLEVQRCTDDEEQPLAAAMKALLLDGDFVVEKRLVWKVRPPNSHEATRVNEPYDFTRLVRSEIFEGRFFKYGCANEYVLWAFAPGTKIANRLSVEEKKIVAEFAEQAQKKSDEPVPQKGGSKDVGK
jgi:hypothetical protein